MKLLHVFAAYLVLLPLCAVVAAQPQQRQKSDSQDAPGKEMVYKQSGGAGRVMEIYFPPNHDPKKDKVPGLILFHGGGWSGGTLSQFRYACAYFAKRGLVTATVQYRMLTKEESSKLPKGETRKRVCITDAKSAIRWFKQQADTLGIDATQIITGGGSAGGHISTLATLNPGLNDPADPKDVDTSVVAYLLFNPAFQTNDDQDKEVDVLRFLKKEMAPAIVFFGTNDSSWKPGWDTAYAKLKKLGNTTTLERLAENQAHGFFNKDPWRTVTLLEADRFLVKQGLLKGEPTLTPPTTGETLKP